MFNQIMCGVKRKFDELEVSEASYIQQRQSILNISMCKLQISSSMKIEPSLRKSVLICNTLKHIESELQTEGVTVSAGTKASYLPSLSNNESTLDPPPSVDISNHKMNSTTAESIETCTNQEAEEVMEEEKKETVHHGISTSFVSPPSDLEHQLRDHLRDSLLNGENKICIASFSSLFDLDFTSTSPSVPSLPTTAQPQNDTQNMPLQTTNFQNVSTPMAWSSQYKADTELLGDLDFSLFDFDVFCPSVPNNKLTPLSAEDLVHSIPGGGAFTDSYNNFSNPHSTCKNEVISDDLDHIMQVLVGM